MQGSRFCHVLPAYKIKMRPDTSLPEFAFKLISIADFPLMRSLSGFFESIDLTWI